jgi:hypothetical protein
VHLMSLHACAHTYISTRTGNRVYLVCLSCVFTHTWPVCARDCVYMWCTCVQRGEEHLQGCASGGLCTHVYTVHTCTHVGHTSKHMPHASTQIHHRLKSWHGVSQGPAGPKGDQQTLEGRPAAELGITLGPRPPAARSLPCLQSRHPCPLGLWESRGDPGGRRETALTTGWFCLSLPRLLPCSILT